MNHPTIRKEFVVQPEWTPDQARALNDFLEKLTNAVPILKTGTYVGTGRIQTIDVADLSSPPAILLIQQDSGSTVFVTMQAYPSGEITAWDRKGFTLSAAATRNTANTTYRYTILA